MLVNVDHAILAYMARAALFCQRYGGTKSGGPAEGWALAPLWYMWIGCDNCRVAGKMSWCWGQARCHGLGDNCGCVECFKFYLDGRGVQYADHRHIGRQGVS